MLKEKLDSRKCFATAWGKLITEEEAYRQLNRQIAPQRSATLPI